MALENILFSDIISGVAPINPGIPGWDAIINQFFSDQHGRHGMGLLARIIGLEDISNTPPGIILINPGIGWRLVPLVILAFGSPGAADTYQFRVEGTGGELWGVSNMTDLSVAVNLLMVFPQGFSSSPQTEIPFVDGDAGETFNILRTGAGPNDTLDLFIYGMAWQSAD
jgi:hypothetical protein